MAINKLQHRRPDGTFASVVGEADIKEVMDLMMTEKYGKKQILDGIEKGRKVTRRSAYRIYNEATQRLYASQVT